MAASRFRLVLAHAVWVGLGFLAFFPILWGDWIYDDFPSVVLNPSLRLAGEWLHPVADGPLGGRPLANALFGLNFAFGGLSPVSYRLVNFGIHLANAFVVAGLIRAAFAGKRSVPETTLAGFSWAVAVIWWLHPLHTSTVGYVAQRTELLAGFFYLLGLRLSLRLGEPSGRGRTWLLVAACAVGGALCKETIATLPFAVALLARLTWASTWREVALRLGRPLVVGTVALAALQVALRAGTTKAGVGELSGVTPLQYARAQAWIWWDYLRLIVWPEPLVFSRGPVLLQNPVSWGWVAATSAALGGVAVGLGRRPQWVWPLAFFGLGLAVTSSFIPLGTQPMAENRLYLAAIAPLAAALWLLYRAWPKMAGWIALALVAVAAVRTQQRYDVQASSADLWADTVAKAPQHAAAWHNWGTIQALKGDKDGAERGFRRALELDPAFGPSFAQLARLELSRGRNEAARGLALQALQVWPHDANVRAQVAYWAYDAGDVSTAELALTPLLVRRLPEASWWALQAWCQAAKGDVSAARESMAKARQGDLAEPFVQAVATRLQLP